MAWMEFYPGFFLCTNLTTDQHGLDGSILKTCIAFQYTCSPLMLLFLCIFKVWRF